jgi:brefeldin A-resistance guanine nucleotide exchange factor 1
MSSSGYLVSPKEDPSKKELWVETWKRIDRFIPDLRTDLALEPEGPEEPEEAEVQTEKPKAEVKVESKSLDEQEDDDAERAAEGSAEGGKAEEVKADA